MAEDQDARPGALRQAQGGGKIALSGKTLILVPARGGSKGLPGKNLAQVGGIPLVGRAARLGRQVAGRLGPGARVVCSTEDDEIASTARAWGAEIPFTRPAELATDEAPGIDVVLHALDALDGDDFDAVVLLQPTSPLTEVQDVLAALDLQVETGAPVVSVCPAEHHASWQYTLDTAGRLLPVLPDEVAHRRQDTTEAYRLNGAVFVSSPQALREHHGFLHAPTRAYVMPAERSVDIDGAQDLHAARAVVAARRPDPVRIGARSVGPGHRCLIVAEAGVNHNGDPALARRQVEAAARAGADAVKFQTFNAAQLATRDAPKADYQVRTTGDDESQLEMLQRLELDRGVHRALKDRCDELGLLFLSSPFDEDSVDLLAELGVPALKIASGEITNLPLLRRVASKGLPVILSTGMSTLVEVDAAVDALSGSGATGLVLLHCVSQYPADPTEVNLRAMGTLRQAFGVPAGYSDHTAGLAAPLAAAALGAAVIEKHLTLDRGLPGPDHPASTEPDEFARMVAAIREVEQSLGSGEKAPTAGELRTAPTARRSLVAAVDIAEGTVLTEAMIAARRPGSGISPARRDRLVGRRTTRPVPAGTPFDHENLALPER